MKSLNEATSLERVAEELTLLPGRISRYFFLLATLDAQASRVDGDLRISRSKVLADLTSGSIQQEGPSAGELNVLRELHLAQRQLLSDKLLVDKKASEWLTRAKDYVQSYQESRRRPRHSDVSVGSPIQDNQNGTLVNGMTPDSQTQLRHRHRMSGVVDETGFDFRSTSLYGLRGPEATSSIVVGSVPKRRRISGQEGMSINRSHNRRSTDGYTSHDSRSADMMRPRARLKQRKSGLFAEATDPDIHGGLIIKLGSQKGRPRKSTNSKGQEITSPMHGEVVQEPLIPSATPDEEYYCPVCGKSENLDPSMVACDSCDKWYHSVCVGFVDDGDTEKSFFCPNCQNSAPNEGESDF